MRLGQFIVLSLLAAAAIGIAAYLGGASGGTIAFRVIATIIVLQIGYFAVILALSALRPDPSPENTGTASPKPRGKTAPPAQD